MTEQSLSKKELWNLRISDYNDSGLTIKEWCNQNKVSISTFRYWLNRLKKQTCNNENTAPVFAELTGLPMAPFIGAAPVTIYMGTVRIEIIDSCHPDLLSNLIGIIKTHA